MWVHTKGTQLVCRWGREVDYRKGEWCQPTTLMIHFLWYFNFRNNPLERHSWPGMWVCLSRYVQHTWGKRGHPIHCHLGHAGISTLSNNLNTFVPSIQSVLLIIQSYDKMFQNVLMAQAPAWPTCCWDEYAEENQPKMSSEFLSHSWKRLLEGEPRPASGLPNVWQHCRYQETACRSTALFGLLYSNNPVSGTGR